MERMSRSVARMLDVMALCSTGELPAAGPSAASSLRATGSYSGGDGSSPMASVGKTAFKVYPICVCLCKKTDKQPRDSFFWWGEGGEEHHGARVKGAPT